MNSMRRRSFIKATAGGIGAIAATRQVPYLRAGGALDEIVVGIIGCSRGLGVAREFASVGARIAYVCDPDEVRVARARKELGADHAVADLRRVLDDKTVDAVVVATPDHWHAPATILACDAGKHVYVEKPCSHNIQEGRLMIRAARRTQRVVQVGSQSRSTETLQNGIQLLREGAIGQVLAAKAWNSQRRADIGHAAPSEPPAYFDYDLWVGPAPMRPFRSNCHHYTWHWWYDFGTGDAGNDGVHELDLALWGLGVDKQPEVISGHGSKLFFRDDQEFPDTQYVTFEFGNAENAHEKLLVYEQRIWSPYTQHGYENGNVFYGTEGYMVMGKSRGWQLFGQENKLIREEKGACSTRKHVANFLQAIRSNAQAHADIEVGHRAATLAHLANIIARTGRATLQFDPQREQIVDAPEAEALVGRKYRQGHWARPRGI